MAIRYFQMYGTLLDDSNALSPAAVMDTLHVTPSSSSITSTTGREYRHQQQARKGSSSVRSSRSPSANRNVADQMSRERDRDSAEPSTSSSIVGLQGIGILGSGISSGTGSGVISGGGSSSSAATVGTVTSGGAGIAATSAATACGSGGGGGGGGGGGSGGISGSASGALRFRNQSPSNRRSRERNRRDFNRSYGSDQGGLLVYGDLPIDAMGSMEDSRLSGNEDLCYQSFASDEPDGNPPALLTDSSKKHHRRHERTTSLQAIDRLNTKIQCTKESIRKEQTARDDNVNEYLKLAAGADKQQLQRIKAVFEKKNQKSAHTIAQLQKKLDSYTKRAKDIQSHQYHNKSQHRQPREVLRDVGQGLRNVGGNIRDGITGFSGSVMSKPREFAHLIKNKFGSADNINQITEAEINALNMPVNSSEVISTPNNAGTIPPQSTGSGNTGGAGSGKFNSDNGSECSSVTSESIPAGSGKSQSGASQYNVIYKTILTQLQERNDEIEKLKERVERLENTQKEFNNLTATLESERYRAEGLEEQINDLTELHQNEIENLKQAIADMEEKVQYQSDERLRDVNEVLENCQTRISKMEHLSQQQYVTVEGIDNSNARALVVKLINVVLTVLQVVLLLVATAAGIIMPFLKTRVRVLTTFFSICFIIFVIRQWPDVKDIGSGLVRHLKESLVVK